MNNSFFKSVQALYKYDLQDEKTTILLDCNSMSIFSQPWTADADDQGTAVLPNVGKYLLNNMRNIPEDVKSSENTKLTHNDETARHDDSHV